MERHPNRLVLMMLTEKQKAVADRVKEILKSRSWFKGVWRAYELSHSRQRQTDE